jgi:ribosomal protein S6--L-glutamate ligase
VLKSHTELSLSLAGVLDTQGARMLNPYRSCVTAQDKIVASRRLRAAGIATPRAWVTGDFRLLAGVVRDTPLIIKPHRGHRGEGIRIIRRPEELERLPSPDGPVIVQEHLAGHGEDLKVYVVGEHVVAVRKTFSPTSFAHAGIPCAISRQIEAMARRCGAVLGLGLYGLDLVETGTGPVVVDVNYFPGYKGVPNAAPLIADYIDEYARGRLSLEMPPFTETATHVEEPVGPSRR